MGELVLDEIVSDPDNIGIVEIEGVADDIIDDSLDSDFSDSMQNNNDDLSIVDDQNNDLVIDDGLETDEEILVDEIIDEAQDSSINTFNNQNYQMGQDISTSDAVSSVEYTKALDDINAELTNISLAVSRLDENVKIIGDNNNLVGYILIAILSFMFGAIVIYAYIGGLISSARR